MDSKTKDAYERLIELMDKYGLTFDDVISIIQDNI